MIIQHKTQKYSFNDLLEIMQILRGDNGCPWDREQTHESIKRNFVEEVYEVVEAIDEKDDALLKEELGDVLLQVVFHAQMAGEESRFDMSDVVDGICKKLIYRHPHIFSNVKAETSDEVLKNWDELKKAEKGQKSQSEVLKSISTYLPALIRSYKIQQKAAKVGFDWDDISSVWDKLYEEIDEVKAEIAKGNKENLENEIGDLFFAAVNLARFLDIDPETALMHTCEKFIKRFSYVEENINERFGVSLSEATLSQMDSLWEEYKKTEK